MEEKGALRTVRYVRRVFITYRTLHIATSPNKKLHPSCGWCEFNKKCWPETRRFVYKTGDVLLVDVVKPPNVPEDFTYHDQE